MCTCVCWPVRGTVALIRFTTIVVTNEGLGLIEPGPPVPTALHLLRRMQWNTFSFHCVNSRALRLNKGKEKKKKKPDTGGLDPATPGWEHESYLNRETTSAPNLMSKSFVLAHRNQCTPYVNLNARYLYTSA